MTDISSSSDFDLSDDQLSDSHDDLIFPPDSDWDEPSSYVFPHAPDQEEEVLRGPGSLVSIAYALNMISVVFLLIGSDTLNLMGYISSGYVAAILIVSYWAVDQQRRALPNYVFVSHRTFLTVTSLLVGIVLAGLHGLALSQTVVPVSP